MGLEILSRLSAIPFRSQDILIERKRGLLYFLRQRSWWYIRFVLRRIIDIHELAELWLNGNKGTLCLTLTRASLHRCY